MRTSIGLQVTPRTHYESIRIPLVRQSLLRVHHTEGATEGLDAVTVTD